jgi:hypothetical protein
LDSGLPIIEVKRTDQLPFSLEQIKLAESVAISACAQNPEWTSRKAIGDVSTYDNDAKFKSSSKGKAFLVEGVWSFFEMCE